jgi:hypothetical protein
MKLISAVSAFAAVAAHVGTVHALTAEEAMCEKYVVEDVQGVLPDFAFPTTDPLARQNAGVLVLKHKTAIKKALAKVGAARPKCAGHLNQGVELVNSKCKEAQCQLWLQEEWTAANITGLEDVNLAYRPKQDQLEALCENADVVMDGVADVIAAHSECNDVFHMTEDSVSKMCIDTSCITSVQDTLAVATPAIVYPTDGQWKPLCASKQVIAAALQGAVEANSQCAGFLGQAKSGLNSACLEQHCQELLGATWVAAMPELAGFDVTKTLSPDNHALMCSKATEVSAGIAETVKAHPECNAYVSLTAVDVNSMCTTSRCLGLVNKNLVSGGHYAAYLYPTISRWTPTGKTPDELNTICASKTQITKALGAVSASDPECAAVVENATEELQTGCGNAIAGSACDQCLVGVASLIRVMPAVDEVVASRFEGQHCKKVDNVLETLTGCESACISDRDSKSLAADVIAHAGKELSRGGECDVQAFNELASKFAGEPANDNAGGASLGLILGAVAGCAVGVAAIGMLVVKARKNGKEAVSPELNPPETKTATIVNPTFEDL